MEKKAIVMGGTSGMGRLVAEGLLKEGWKVGVAGRRAALLAELEAAYPGAVVTEVIDVTAPDAPESLLRLVGKLGGMDLYFHSTGVGNQNRELDIKLEETMMLTNVYGFSRMIDTAFNWFKNNGKPGQIAAISSIAGFKGMSNAAAYSATKRFQWTYLQALSQLSRSEKLGISFTELRPGFVATDFIHYKYPMEMKPEYVVRQILKAVRCKKRTRIIDWRYRILCFFWQLIPGCIWERIKLPTQKERA